MDLSFRELIKNRIVKNAGWIIAGKLIKMLFGFFVGILTARYLGPSGYGLISYAGAYTAFFAAFCSLGIDAVLVRELVRGRDSQGEVMGTALLLKAVSSFLSALMIIGLVSIIDRGERLTIAVTALCSISVIFNALDTLSYWFQAQLKSKTASLASVAAYLIVCVYKLLLIYLGCGVKLFALSTSVDCLCVGVILMLAYVRCGGQRLSVSGKYAKSLLKQSLPFVLPALMVSVYAQTDKLMLKNMAGEASTGCYAIAVTLCTVWCFVLSAIIDSISPQIMEKHRLGDKEGFESENRLMYAIVFYLSLFVSALICIFAEPVVSILYGEAYLPAVKPLRIITWYTAFSYLGVARNTWIVCEEKQRYLSAVYVASAVVNVALNALLIPKMGASGAALASVAAQIMTVTLAPLFIKALRPNVRMMADAILLKGIKSK